jgi:hypothetical protein
MDQHRRTTAVAVLSPTAASNAAIATAVYIAVTTAVAAAITLNLLQLLPPSSPSQPLSPSSSMPLLPPPPCLLCHYCCSLHQHHCASVAPVDGWLLCRLSPLTFCIIRPSNLSAPAIMRSSTLSLPAAVYFCLLLPSTVLSLFYQASIAFAALIDGWLLHSLTTQQHTDHITMLKMFPVSTSWTFFDLLKVSTMPCLTEELFSLLLC